MRFGNVCRADMRRDYNNTNSHAVWRILAFWRLLCADGGLDIGTVVWRSGSGNRFDVRRPVRGHGVLYAGNIRHQGVDGDTGGVYCKGVFKEKRKYKTFGYITGGIVSEALMIGGYFMYKWLLLGRGYAAAAESVPTNFLQGAFGLVAGVIIMQAVIKTPVLKNFHAYAV